MFIKFCSLISCFNSILLAAVLYIRHKHQLRVYSLLIVLLMLMALYSGVSFIHYLLVSSADYVDFMGYFLPVEGIFLMAMGPCLYFYIRALVGMPVNLHNSRWLYHLIPSFLFIGYNVFLFLLPENERIDWLRSNFESGTTIALLLNIILYIQLFGYLWASHIAVMPNTEKVNHQNAHMAWLKQFIIINLVFLGVSAPLCFYFCNGYTSLVLGQLAMNLDFLFLFFQAFMQQSVSSSNEPENTMGKDSTFRLNNSLALSYLDMLQQYMQVYKPHLSEDCSIQSLAEMLNIPVHHLSQSINIHLQKNFADYINEKRIEEAKYRLCDPAFELLTIESIAADCGFSSKTTFNRAFKKYCNNQTPSAYRKQWKLPE